MKLQIELVDLEGKTVDSYFDEEEAKQDLKKMCEENPEWQEELMLLFYEDEKRTRPPFMYSDLG